MWNKWMLAICASVTILSQVDAGPFAPAAGQPGSTAIANTSPLFVAWASGVSDLVRGAMDIANPGGELASFGSGADAIGPASGNPLQVVSLGDGGRITLTFDRPIADGAGFDFAVFENGFADNFLELAFVEVSTNGVDFVRFPSVSLTPVATQIGGFSPLDPTNLDQLAGKYRGGFGTPFDLAMITGLSPLVDPAEIRFVRLVDVVGSIDPAFATLDSFGNRVNDPYPTAFASGGFDLDGVGVLHQIPEPSSLVLLLAAALCLLPRRRKCRA